MYKNLLAELKWQLLHDYEDKDLVSQIKALFEIMERYYDISDLDSGTVHSKVFYDLYLNPHSKPYIDIAFDNNCSERNINRFVDKYNELAKKIIVKKFPALRERYSAFFKKNN